MSEERNEDEIVTLEIPASDAHEEEDPRDAELRQLRERLARAEATADSAAKQANDVAAQAAARVQESQVNQIAAHEQAVNARVEAAERALNAVKEAHKAAMQSGDFDKATELADEIANARTQLNAANWEKGRLEEAKKTGPKEEQQQRVDPTAGLTDPTDKLIASVQSPASKRWLGEHREIAQKMAMDPKFYARMVAFDNLAVADGNSRDTPEYFSYIEDKLSAEGILDQANNDKGSTAAPATRQRATPRDSGGSRQIRLDDVAKKLTPDMRAAAKVSFPNMSDADAYKAYAKGIVMEKQRDPNFLPNFKL